MNQQTTVEERFGLARSNFVVNPVSEADFWAPRSDINIDSLVENLRVDLVIGLAPKRFIWGPYGGGKTHTLHHTMRELEKMTPIHPVHIDCPDLSRRSTFLDLYRDGIMHSLGEDFVLGLFDATLEKIGYARREEFLRKLNEALDDQELSKAVARLQDPNFDRIKLWAFLSGVSVGKSDLTDLGQTQDMSSAESSRLAELIILVGRLSRTNLGKTLVLILDEMDRLGPPSGPGAETIVTFQTAFRRLVDPSQKTVSILIGCSAVARSDFPDIFAGEAVMGRLGRDPGFGEIEIRELVDPDVDRFIKSVIEHFRNQDADIASLIQSASSGTSETINEDFFPFTVEAIAALKGRLSQIMTPREVTLTMSRLLGKAYLLNKPVVTSDVV
ncbi:hypothetical protein ES703_08149 [subsurface metagenome]